MKSPWLAYAIVAVLAVGAGVAIAGLPDNSSVDATITVTGATDSTTATTTSDTAPATSAVPTTETSPATTAPAGTTAPTTPPVTTEAPATTTPETTAAPTTSVPELIERSELAVVAANGSNVGGSASRMAARLEALGYVDVAPRDGTIVEEFTVVYFAEGLEGEALRLAGELDLLDEFIGPIDTAPNVIDLPPETQLLVYTGLDRA